MDGVRTRSMKMKASKIERTSPSELPPARRSKKIRKSKNGGKTSRRQRQQQQQGQGNGAPKIRRTQVEGGVTSEYSSPKNLPEGWEMEKRTTKFTDGTFRCDSYYKGPGTRQFRSMLEVNKYLENNSPCSSAVVEVEGSSSMNDKNTFTKEEEASKSGLEDMPAPGDPNLPDPIARILEEFDIGAPETFLSSSTSDCPADLSLDDYGTIDRVEIR